MEGVNIMTSVMSCSDWDTLRHPASDVIQTQQHGRHVITTRCQWDIQLGVISIAVVINVVFADYLTQREELVSLLCSHKRHQYQWHWSTKQHHPDRLLNLTRGTFPFASSARLRCHSFCLCGLKGFSVISVSSHFRSVSLWKNCSAFIPRLTVREEEYGYQQPATEDMWCSWNHDYMIAQLKPGLLKWFWTAVFRFFLHPDENTFIDKK